jgi:vancomycin resistance protein YoaR
LHSVYIRRELILTIAGVLVLVGVMTLYLHAQSTNPPKKPSIASRIPQATQRHAAAGNNTVRTEKRADILVTPLNEKEWSEFNEKKQQLLRSTLTLRIAEVIPELKATTWLIPLREHTDWIVVDRRYEAIRATVSAKSVRNFIEETILADIPTPKDASIIALPKQGSNQVTIAGKPRDGWILKSDEAAQRVANDVGAGLLTVTLPVEYVEGRIVNRTPVNLGTLQLLARGRSNFAGSVPNRIFNIEKALNEHLANILIAPGETFSFVDAIGKEIEVYNGWKTALGIFNGTELAPTPGGGICQTSTTLYRALLQAGLKIEKQRNHSIYVSFYRKYGEGLDATIYPGTQDLVFTNDTPSHLLLQAYTDGNDAFIELYGTPDGRRVVLEGPYRNRDAPPEIRFHEKLRWGLGASDIAWRQRIIRSDGTEEENILVSRYKLGIPLSPPDDKGLTLFDPLSIDGTPETPLRVARR